MTSVIAHNAERLCCRSLLTSYERISAVQLARSQLYAKPFSSSSTTFFRLSKSTWNSHSSTKPPPHPDVPVKQDVEVYQGPLTSTFKRLKIFSLASLGLSSTLAPFMFLIESNLPTSARFALAGIALGTSGLSTSLVAWCAHPYVTTMTRFHPEGKGYAEELEMTTNNLFLRRLTTRVYDPSFLIETRRPLARWELAREITLTPDRTAAVGTNVHPAPGLEETVAETRNEKGEVVGSWVVTWAENGVGSCRDVGRVVRYFNVHEELLK